MKREIVEFEPTEYQRAVAMAAIEAWHARKPGLNVMRFVLPRPVDASVRPTNDSLPSFEGAPTGEVVPSGIFVPALGPDNYAGVRIYAADHYFLYVDGRFFVA